MTQLPEQHSHHDDGEQVSPVGLHPSISTQTLCSQLPEQQLPSSWQ
jgi:hypothetical protein